jgi:hypothetical protein
VHALQEHGLLTNVPDVFAETCISKLLSLMELAGCLQQGAQIEQENPSSPSVTSLAIEPYRTLVASQGP